MLLSILLSQLVLCSMDSRIWIPIPDFPLSFHLWQLTVHFSHIQQVQNGPSNTPPAPSDLSSITHFLVQLATHYHPVTQVRNLDPPSSWPRTSNPACFLQILPTKDFQNVTYLHLHHFSNFTASPHPSHSLDYCHFPCGVGLSFSVQIKHLTSLQNA